MTQGFTESVVEQAALPWLESMDYTTLLVLETAMGNCSKVLPQWKRNKLVCRL